jgi:hypothetical protein
VCSLRRDDLVDVRICRIETAPVAGADRRKAREDVRNGLPLALVAGLGGV